jgi:hypothetical protein
MVGRIGTMRELLVWSGERLACCVRGDDPVVPRVMIAADAVRVGGRGRV